MFPEWTWVLGLFIGAAIGSFLNVVIYRMPRDISLSDPPRSFCPACDHTLGTLDLFPLLSWLFLRGKCRYCHKPVPSRYFFVELITGSLWATVWYQHLVLGWDPIKAVCYAFTLAALVAIVYIDWEHYIIPDEINAFLLIPGIVVQISDGKPMNALYGALLGWGMLWGTAVFGRGLFGKDAMGHGDIKMMRGIGAVLGPFLVGVSYAMGIAVGLLVSIALLFFIKGPEPADSPDEEEEEENVAQQLKSFILWTVILLAIPTIVCVVAQWPIIYGLLVGAVGMLIRIIIRPRTQSGPKPESWKSLILCGFFYLVLLDVICLFSTKLNQKLGLLIPDGQEEEEFEATVQHIPFGPYLAFGSALCILFGEPIIRFVRQITEQYWGTSWPL